MIVIGLMALGLSTLADVEESACYLLLFVLLKLLSGKSRARDFGEEALGSAKLQ